MNLKSWEEAAAKYPRYTTEEAMARLQTMKIRDKNGLTKPFKDFCQAAVNSSPQDIGPVNVKGSKAYFVPTPYSALTKEAILQGMPDFQGASLIISGNCAQVCMYMLHVCAQVYYK